MICFGPAFCPQPLQSGFHSLFRRRNFWDARRIAIGLQHFWPAGIHTEPTTQNWQRPNSGGTRKPQKEPELIWAKEMALNRFIKTLLSAISFLQIVWKFFAVYLQSNTRPCLKIGNVSNGEEFFRQTRRFDAAILCVLRGKSTQYGGKRTAVWAYWHFSNMA